MRREVLKVLEDNARATPRQIAAMTGLPEDEVARTIKEAEEQRVILKYKTVINWEKLGGEPVWALIEVKVAPQREAGFDSTAYRIARFPEVHSLYLVSGTYDLAVLVSGRTMQDIAAFVAGKLAPLESVQGTVTHFLLRKYKEDGELLAEDTEGGRLPFTP